MDGADSELHFDFVTLDKVKDWQPSDMTGKWVTYQIDRENSLGIFTLTSCTCNDEYYSVLDDFFKEIFAEGIENIAVDLRGNGGGNSWVANEFIKYLNAAEYRGFDSAVRYGRYLVKNENVTYKNQKKKQVFNGNLYVLTDTFAFLSKCRIQGFPWASHTRNGIALIRQGPASHSCRTYKPPRKKHWKKYMN